MDYTVIPKSVKSTIESGGSPLTEDQYMLLCGALAAVQTMIESIGLDATIESLKPMAKGRE